MEWAVSQAKFFFRPFDNLTSFAARFDLPGLHKSVFYRQFPKVARTFSGFRFDRICPRVPNSSMRMQMPQNV